MADTDILHTAEILKAALPYVDVRTRTTMDLLVKFYELILCFRRTQTNSLVTCGYEEQKADIETMLNNIRPLCKDKERAMVDRFIGFYNAKRMFEMYNTYMSAMKTMQEFGGFPSGDGGEASDGFMNNFSGLDFSSIFGNSTDSNSDIGPDTDSSSEYPGDDFTHQDQESEEKPNSDDTKDDQSRDGNSQMFDTLKNMIPPEQMSTFENLRMLFNTMSYDNNKKTDSK